MALKVRYPQVTGPIYDALGIYDTYNQDFGILVAVRLFLSGSNTYSDPIPVSEVDVIGGLPGGGGGGGVATINGLTGNINLVPGTGIAITPSGSNLTISATGSGGGGGGGGVSSFNGRTGNVLPAANDYSASQIAGFDEAVDDRVANLLVPGTGITLTYNDAANTITIESSATSSPITDEQIDDRVANLLVPDPQLVKQYDDTANTLRLGVVNAPLLDTVFTEVALLPSPRTPGTIYFERSLTGGAFVDDSSNGTGQLTYGFFWWFDGTRWRSPRFEWRTSQSNLTLTNFPDKYSYFYVPEPGLFKSIFISRFKLRAYLYGPNDPSNYWTFNLSSPSNTMASVNTGGSLPGTWINREVIVNAEFDISSGNLPVMFILPLATGAPGRLEYAAEMIYYWVRLGAPL